MEAIKPKEYEETTQWDHLVGVGEHLAIMRRKPNHAPLKRERLIGGWFVLKALKTRYVHTL